MDSKEEVSWAADPAGIVGGHCASATVKFDALATLMLIPRCCCYRFPLPLAGVLRPRCMPTTLLFLE
jgi:hypothetical protein